MQVKLSSDNSFMSHPDYTIVDVCSRIILTQYLVTGSFIIPLIISSSDVLATYHTFSVSNGESSCRPDDQKGRTKYGF
jgi:hypothetical protein